MEWIKLTDRMPNPDEHDRVLIYTEGSQGSAVQVAAPVTQPVTQSQRLGEPQTGEGKTGAAARQNRQYPL